MKRIISEEVLSNIATYMDDDFGTDGIAFCRR